MKYRELEFDFGQAMPKRSAASKAPRAGAAAAASQLQAQLEIAYGAPIRLRVNDNSSTLISWKGGRNGTSPQLSLHHMFLAADPAVVRALAQFVKRPTPACRALLRRFMNGRTADVRPKTTRIQLRSRGTVYDLHKLADEVNAEFFAGAITARITWSRGRRTPERRRRHITFGTYDAAGKLIRIHPALDSTEVPEYFVKFVIYHEMLHALLDPVHSADGRRYVHTAEFRKRERKHPDYARSIAWEKQVFK